AHITYDTAWLKHHYPTEFFTANCNHVIGDLHRSEHDKLREFIYDAKEFNIDIILPSIMVGNNNFEIQPDGTIRYGLAFIKGVGEAQIPIVEMCKGEATFSEFLSKALTVGLKKDVIEALICSGALDHYKLT